MKEKYLSDITEIPIQHLTQMKCAEDDETVMQMKQHTPARIGLGHYGARYGTKTLLRFYADQAAAADAVFSEVSKDVVESLGLFEVRTCCRNKTEMITRPDWGRQFDEENKRIIMQKCIHAPQVQIYAGDGLCSPSIAANLPDMLPAMIKGLMYEGITTGTPFFVRYCRVNTARIIAELLSPLVTCVLIGERPGLITAESMSAYIAYGAYADMPESRYTVVSNISRQGMPPVEAAAYIVDLIQKMLTQKTSGLDLL